MGYTSLPSPSAPVKPTGFYGVLAATPSRRPAGGVYAQLFQPAAAGKAPATVNTPTSSDPGKRLQSLAIAVGLFATALLTHRLPGRAAMGKNFLLTPDWKVWTRVLLGVGATYKLNKGMDWKPPPWLNAMQTVAVLHPLLVGFSRKYPLEVGVMAPLIAGVVSIANALNQTLAPLADTHIGIPEKWTKLGVSLGVTLASIGMFPSVIARIAKTGILGKAAQAQARQGKNIAFGAVAIGANCGCGNVICISQMGEIFGGLGNWLKSDSSRR